MEKAFPDNYSAPVLKVLDAMTIGTLTIIGSSASRKQQYSSDYDANDKVDVLRLEDVVPKLNHLYCAAKSPEKAAIQFGKILQSLSEQYENID